VQQRKQVRAMDAARASRDMLTRVAQVAEDKIRLEKQRVAAEQERVAAMTRDLSILRLALSLMRVPPPPPAPTITCSLFHVAVKQPT